MFVRRRQLAVRSLAMLFVSGFDAANAQLAARKPAGANAPATLPSKETLIARAKRFELNTPYVPPPGDPLEHNTSGYANTMCAAVFITGLDPVIAAENVGFFTGPYEERKKVGKPVVDREKKEVRISIPDGPTIVSRRASRTTCPALADRRSLSSLRTISSSSGSGSTAVISPVPPRSHARSRS